MFNYNLWPCPKEKKKKESRFFLNNTMEFLIALLPMKLSDKE